LKRIAASIHEGLRLNKTPCPIPHSKSPLAVPISLKPSRRSEITRERSTSVGTAVSFYTTAVSGERGGTKRIYNGETDIVSSGIVASARITKTYNGLKSGAHNGNLAIT
jgi:hypothetical protein